MFKSFDIMLSDLKEEKQKEFLDFLGVSGIEETNYDVFPIAVFDLELEETE